MCSDVFAPPKGLGNNSKLNLWCISHKKKKGAFRSQHNLLEEMGQNDKGIFPKNYDGCSCGLWPMLCGY
jgi:hypothetical protein